MTALPRSPGRTPKPYQPTRNGVVGVAMAPVRSTPTVSICASTPILGILSSIGASGRRGAATAPVATTIFGVATKVGVGAGGTSVGVGGSGVSVAGSGVHVGDGIGVAEFMGTAIEAVALGGSRVGNAVGRAIVAVGVRGSGTSAEPQAVSRKVATPTARMQTSPGRARRMVTRLAASFKPGSAAGDWVRVPHEGKLRSALTPAVAGRSRRAKLTWPRRR